MIVSGFSVNPASDLRAAEAAAERGLALVPDDPHAHAALCAVQRLHQNRLEEALASCNRAVELSPALHPARANAGWLLVLLGQACAGEAAIRASIASAAPEHAQQPIWHHYLGTALLLCERDHEAVAAFRRGLHAWRVHHRATMVGLIASLALTGQQTEAGFLLAEARQRWPDLSIARVRADSPSEHPAFLSQRERLMAGLALAGLP